LKIEADIVVIGAGPAGICAAISAARLGSRVVLAGDRPVLGGNSSSEIRVWTRGATGAGNIFSEEMGSWGDFKLRNLYSNTPGNPVLWDEVLLEGVLREKNITLLLNTHITNLKVKDEDTIEFASGFQMASEQNYEIYGKMFIDCTGDATLGALAGVPYRVGKEARDEYNEGFAPLKEEKSTLGNTIFFFSKKVEEKVDFVKPEFAYDQKHIEGILGKGGRVVGENYNGCDYWWFEYGGILDTISDAQEISLELKRLVFGVWNYIKNSGRFDSEHLTLEWVGSLPGKRESRRMVTDYILTQNDVMNGTMFPDGAFYGGWYLDFHPSEGIYTEEENCSQIAVSIYDIPLRCLYNKKISNLLFAGRDIGTTHAAFASTRIMNTCALSGQAAGTLAHACIGFESAPAELEDKEIESIRQTLLKDDMLVLGCKNNDPLDLARSAKVTASSVASGLCEKQSGSISLAQGGFLVVPRSDEGFELLLTAEQSCVLAVNFYISCVPSRFCYGAKVCSMEINVPEGTNWVRVPIPSHDEDGFFTMEFLPTDYVSIATSAEGLTGILGGHQDQAEYWYPCIRFEPKQLYAVENIINGFHRPYNKPNVWISGAEAKPELTLSWENPQKINEIRLYLNPDLSKELPSSRAANWAPDHKFIPRDGMPGQLVREYQIYAKQNGDWKLIASEKDNWRRLAVHRLEKAIETTELKFVFVSTYGGDNAEVFEIRVY